MHKARREHFGGRHYDDMITRLRIKQAFGRLVRRASDRGVFVMLDARTPSRLLQALPEGTDILRLGAGRCYRRDRRLPGHGLGCALIRALG